MATYVREEPTATVEQIMDEYQARTRNRRIWAGELCTIGTNIDVGFDTDRTPTFELGDREVPSSDSGVALLADFIGVPSRFLDKVTVTEKQMILHERLQRTPGEAVITYNDNGIVDIIKPGAKVLDPFDIMEVAADAVAGAEDTLVLDFFSGAEEFRLDVIPAHDTDYTGGDPGVGDLTRGGLRFYQNRKAGTAPSVQHLLYRLICTNGMEVPDLGLKISARGNDVEQIVMDLRTMAERAMSRVGDKITEFYNLRNKEISGEYSQTMLRAGREVGLSQRMIDDLIDMEPAERPTDRNPTMFDLVNTITNLANKPEYYDNHSARTKLQRGGGTLARVEHDRCPQCQQVVA